MPDGGLMERLTRMMPASRDALPAGDFREWADIVGWTEELADELTRAPAGTAGPAEGSVLR